MTEDEAKKKWCPFVRVSCNADNTRLFDNRGHAMKEGDNTHLLCLGSECMLWRTTGKSYLPKGAAKRTEVSTKVTIPIGIKDVQLVGRCGLTR